MLIFLTLACSEGLTQCRVRRMRGWGVQESQAPPTRPGNPAASPTNTQPGQPSSGIPRHQDPPLANDLRELKMGDDFTQAGRQAGRRVSQPVIMGRPGPRYKRLGTHMQTGT